MTDWNDLHVPVHPAALLEPARKRQEEKHSKAADPLVGTATDNGDGFDRHGADLRRRAEGDNDNPKAHYPESSRTLTSPLDIPRSLSEEPRPDGLIASSHDRDRPERTAAGRFPQNVAPLPQSPAHLRRSQSCPVFQRGAILESIQTHLVEIDSFLRRQEPHAGSVPDSQSRKFRDHHGHVRAGEELLRCARGEYPQLWYKFKRFETLALLNLYHYQHELVELETRIYYPIRGGPGTMDGTMVTDMRRLLREYYKAVASFREISRMERPSIEERRDIAGIWAATLNNWHYKDAADAYSMMDLTPPALGVEKDPLRTMIRAIHIRLSGGPSKIRAEYSRSSAKREVIEPEMDAHERAFHERDWPGRRKGSIDIEYAHRPYHLPISNGVDLTARIFVSVIAGIFLLIPVFALSYINNKTYRLVTTSLFTLLFAVSLSVMSSAKNQEVMAATAAYTAVLVVFLGQTSSGPQPG